MYNNYLVNIGIQLFLPGSKLMVGKSQFLTFIIFDSIFSQHFCFPQFLFRVCFVWLLSRDRLSLLFVWFVAAANCLSYSKPFSYLKQLCVSFSFYLLGCQMMNYLNHFRQNYHLQTPHYLFQCYHLKNIHFLYTLNNLHSLFHGLFSLLHFLQMLCFPFMALIVLLSLSSFAWTLLFPFDLEIIIIFFALTLISFHDVKLLAFGTM